MQRMVNNYSVHSNDDDTCLVGLGDLNDGLDEESLALNTQHQSIHKI